MRSSREAETRPGSQDGLEAKTEDSAKKSDQQENQRLEKHQEK